MEYKKTTLSAISPVFNEEKNLLLFAKKLIAALNQLKKKWEIIFVNDGSKDKSSEILEKIAKNNKRIKVIEFTRNFGQTAAISAGIKRAKGDVIVLIDSDLQNDPADIGKLLTQIDAGFDVVSGWRKKRKDPISRVLPSIIANKIVSQVVGAKLHDFGCTLKAYRAQVLSDLVLYGESHRLIPAHAAFSGAKITEVVVSHHPRRFGQSNYNMWRIFKLVFDLSTIKFLNDFSTKPLYLFGSTGLITFFLAILIFIFVTIRVIFFGGEWVSPLILLSGLAVILAVQFVLIGLLAEILVRIYFESQRKPPYIIKKTFNL